MRQRRQRQRQSPADRIKRLHRGGCPIHGIPMQQIASGFVAEDGRPYAIVECPRGDCGVRARAYGEAGPWELEPEWVGLLTAE